MAKQLIVDLYGCDSLILNDENKLKNISKEIVESIGGKIVEEHICKFEPVGITYFAVISTSHFSIHTWPENSYAAIDLFSCNEFDEKKIIDKLKKLFLANAEKSMLFERRVKTI